MEGYSAPSVEYEILDNPILNVKNKNKFPNRENRTCSVKFPVIEEEFISTFFLIDTNVVMALASNLESYNKGDRARLIIDSFSKEPMKWENIIIKGSETKGKGKKGKDKDENLNESLDNITSKLSIILFDSNLQ